MNELQDLKVVFMGTPQFAVPSLKLLLEAGLQVPLCITQPDRPAGRGQKIVPCPVKELALEKGIPVRQPLKIRDDRNLIEELKALKPDLMVTAAFGQIISQEIIDIPRWGIWNVHASLLPRWRGAAPINWCLLAGDQETGVTIMKTEKGLDTGPMLTKASLAVSASDDAETLTEKLSKLGSELLLQTIRQNLQKEIQPQTQDETLVTHAAKLGKHLSPIVWESMTASEIERRIRALKPWPGVTFKTSSNEIIKLTKAAVTDKKSTGACPGEVLALEPRGFTVCCQSEVLMVLEVQPPNKTKMNAADWLRGQRFSVGSLLN